MPAGVRAHAARSGDVHPAGRRPRLRSPGGGRDGDRLPGRRRSARARRRGWTCAATDMPGRVGSNGVRELWARRSGDGTTPGGVFGLGSMRAPTGETFQFFGNEAPPRRSTASGAGSNPVTAGARRPARPTTTCWSPARQRVQQPRRVPAEHRRLHAGGPDRRQHGPGRSGDDPSEPPYAAAIFLHRHSYDANGNARPTSGCVSLNADNLARVLTRLVPGEAWFVIR